jgi:hypothetical protein
MNKKTIIACVVTGLVVYMAKDKISQLPLISKLPTL